MACYALVLGAALVAYERGHISVEVIGAFLPPAGKRVLAFLANSCTLAFLVILIYAGLDFTDRTWFQRSASLGVPMRWVYLAIPIGALLETWFMLAAWLQAREPSTAEAEALL